jgi:hypothetical protein
MRNVCAELLASIIHGTVATGVSNIHIDRQHGYWNNEQVRG